MTSPAVSLVADCKCSLGEGPLWAFGRVFWFDINNSDLLSCQADGADFRRKRLPARASAAMPAADGRLVVACDQGLAQCDADGGNFAVFAPLEADMPDNRSNDAKGDPDGNFWVGTMSHSHIPDSGSIYRCTPRMGENGTGGVDGVDIRRVFSPLSTPNCIAFSPDGDTMWHTDTRKRKILSCAVNRQTGETGPPRVFADLNDWTGKPDGSAIDAEGFLWVALWDGKRVARFAPDGTLDLEIPLPVSRPTCPVFGGDDLRTVFVTSASERLSAGDLQKQPTAGGLFSFRADAPGLPSPVFGRRGFGGVDGPSGG